MNVAEMLMEIPKRWPSSKLRVEWYESPYPYFSVTLENGWIVGVGFGLIHYSGTRMASPANPLESTTVEVAIFKPSGDWFLTEGMVTNSKGTTGVLSWQTSDEVFQILDYVSKKEPSA